MASGKKSHIKKPTHISKRELNLFKSLEDIFKVNDNKINGYEIIESVTDWSVVSAVKQSTWRPDLHKTFLAPAKSPKWRRGASQIAK